MLAKRGSTARGVRRSCGRRSRLSARRAAGARTGVPKGCGVVSIPAKIPHCSGLGDLRLEGRRLGVDRRVCLHGRAQRVLKELRERPPALHSRDLQFREQRDLRRSITQV
jgi:hypothetical protein